MRQLLRALTYWEICNGGFREFLPKIYEAKLFYEQGHSTTSSAQKILNGKF